MSTMLQGKTFILFKLSTIKKKNEKWELRSEMTIFDSEIIFLGLDWEKMSSYEQKHFGETKNRLCKESTA